MVITFPACVGIRGTTFYLLNSCPLQELVFTLPPEEKSHGTISFTTYYKYFRAGANLLVLAVMLLFFVVGEVSE